MKSTIDLVKRLIEMKRYPNVRLHTEDSQTLQDAITALTNAEQPDDDLTIAYMAGHHKGKTKQAKPLTEEETKVLFRRTFPSGPFLFTNDVLVFTRAIEQAHGIGEQK